MDRNEQNGLVAVDSEVLARHCVEICTEGKAQDIRLFDVQKHSILADFFLICSGMSSPHLRALAERIRLGLAEDGLQPRGRDGDPGSQWIVLDYGLIIIHIIDPDLRDFYKIEELWEAGNLVQNPSEADANIPDEN